MKNNMRWLPIFRWAWLVAAALLLAVSGCVTEPRNVFHSFSFGGYGDNQGIEILNYRYGESKLTATRPPDWSLATGHIGQGANIGGAFPVGDSLYVKWRIDATGAVYDDTVDLRNRLPHDMTDQRIHFVIKGPQLYVYLISEQLHAAGAPDCPVTVYRIFKCTSVYPERKANF